MKSKILYLLLALMIAQYNAFAGSLKNWIILEYVNGNDSLPEKAKETAYNEYLRSREDDWIYFQFKNPLNYNARTSYADCMKLCGELSKFFSKKGLAAEEIVMKRAPEFYLMVYKKPGISLNANFVSLPEKWKQKYVVSNKEGGSFETKSGHLVVFPPYAFEVINGDSVHIEMYEIDSKKQFAESGYTASSSDQLLESNGMFKIKATQGNVEIKLKPDVNAEIRYKKNAFENSNEKNTYNTFYGKEGNNEIDWQPNAEQKVGNTPGYREITTTYSYTETHYVQLCRKINYLEPTIAQATSECLLSEVNYNFIVKKYGELMYIENNNYHPIKSYENYKVLMVSNFNWIFIGLTKEQNDKLTADEIAEKQRLEAARIEEEKARQKKAEEDAKAQAIIDKHPISMAINQLGNINCDRFNNVPLKTDIIVKIDDTNFDQIKVYAIFSNIKSVIHGQYLPSDKGNIVFHNLPQGENVVYMAAIFKGNDVKMAYLNKAIISKDIISLSLKSYTNQQYSKILDEIIKN